jgi:mannitol-specific phosphotransferase system IIBC component
MKSIIKAVALVVAVAAPVVSFAQADLPLTRAKVTAELVQLEKAGYSPATSRDTTYPADIQAAESRVQAQAGGPAKATVVADSGVGSGTSGASKSGAPVKHLRAADDIYFGN